jgi:hypothetical protein
VSGVREEAREIPGAAFDVRKAVDHRHGLDPDIRSRKQERQGDKVVGSRVGVHDDPDRRGRRSLAKGVEQDAQRHEREEYPCHAKRLRQAIRLSSDFGKGTRLKTERRRESPGLKTGPTPDSPTS